MKRAASILALGALLAGCSDPYARSPHGVTPPTPRQAPPSGGATMTARSFARHWVNWGWRSAASQQRALADLATGQLAADLRANAASARMDASLTRDKPSVRGVVAIVNLKARGPLVAGLIVTREQSYTAGRPDIGGAHYRVYAITLGRRGGRWEVSAWKPQP
jgi:hypothetical protein